MEWAPGFLFLVLPCETPGISSLCGGGGVFEFKKSVELENIIIQPKVLQI